MAKLDYLQAKKLNPADELRHLLSSLEERQVKIKSFTSTQALILLRDLDQLFYLFDQITATGLDLLPEEGRFTTLQAQLRKSAGRLLTALGGPSALREFRPTPTPSEDRWWWFIDDIVSAQQKRLRQRLVVGLGVVLLLVGGVILAFNTVLAPSPEVVARIEAENNAYLAIDEGDYQAALSAIGEGLSRVPDEPNLLLLQGVLQEALGAEADAAESFALVQAKMTDPLSFFVSRSQLELRVNRPEKAEADARAALEIDDSSARAWLLLGQALEGQGDVFEAISAYESASRLAFESGDNQVVVIARLALARLGMGGAP